MYSGRKAYREVFSVGLPQHHRSKSDLEQGFTLSLLRLGDNWSEDAKWPFKKRAGNKYFRLASFKRRPPPLALGDPRAGVSDYLLDQYNRLFSLG
jgi:hypothetical protein